VTPGPLAGETIWYEDPARKQVHRDLVLAGMEQARQQGKRIGRPGVSERLSLSKDGPGRGQGFEIVC